MLGALILQVMERSEIESLKVMIYLIEGVLPKGYFSGSLGGLQADMAVFRDILSTRMPKLSKHLQKLQGTIGDSKLSVFSFVYQNKYFDKEKKLYYKIISICIPLSIQWLEIRFNGSTINKCIYNAMVFDFVLYVPAKKLCVTCLGFGFD